MAHYHKTQTLISQELLPAGIGTSPARLAVAGCHRARPSTSLDKKAM